MGRIKDGAKGAAVCVVATLATGGATSLAFAIAWRFAETDWFHVYHVSIFVIASFLGGCAGGTAITVFWPGVKAGFAIAGPVIFWALLFASPNPWLRDMPLAWGESLAAVAGALFGWWGWRQLREQSLGAHGKG